MVIFSNRSKLNKINVSRDTVVLEISDAIKHLKRAEKHCSDIISISDINKYLELLLNKTLMDKDTKNNHIEQVKTLAEKK